MNCLFFLLLSLGISSPLVAAQASLKWEDVALGVEKHPQLVMAQLRREIAAQEKVASVVALVPAWRLGSELSNLRTQGVESSTGMRFYMSAGTDLQQWVKSFRDSGVHKLAETAAELQIAMARVDLRLMAREKFDKIISLGTEREALAGVKERRKTNLDLMQSRFQNGRLEPNIWIQTVESYKEAVDRLERVELSQVAEIKMLAELCALKVNPHKVKAEEEVELCRGKGCGLEVKKQRRTNAGESLAERVARNKLAISKARVEESRDQFLPSVSLSLGVGSQSELAPTRTKASAPELTLSLRVELPLDRYLTAAGDFDRSRQAFLEQQVAAQNVVELVRQTRLEIQQLETQIELSEKELKSLVRGKESIEKQQSVLRYGYKAGRVNFDLWFDLEDKLLHSEDRIVSERLRLADLERRLQHKFGLALYHGRELYL